MASGVKEMNAASRDVRNNNIAAANKTEIKHETTA